MAKRKSKARARLRQLQSMLNQQRQYHQELNEKLTALDDDLYHVIQAQQFYQQALLALTTWECDPESWLTGSLVVERHLRLCADELIQQWSELRQWANHQSTVSNNSAMSS